MENLTDHELKSAESRSLCEFLVQNLSQRISNLQCKAARHTCSIFQQDRKCFAYVSHQKPGKAIRVHCLGKYEELAKAAEASEVNVELREKQVDNGGWSQTTSCHFKLENLQQVADAAKILIGVSYPQSLIKKNKTKHNDIDEVFQLTGKTLRPLEYPEGNSNRGLVNIYERNKKAHDRCIEIHGMRCKICDFDFETKYGVAGKGLIHVHHLKPLSDIKHEYKVNPEYDLCPICPNCHAIVHTKTPPYTIDEVRDMLTPLR